ncbi:dual specificity protein kinase [Pseudohyphozyma bogoriensis]|nr:dual specificity protein kinase [Pseudohyphozyma bogoriensis]KAI5474503.1 dual specificity protein kinase [Pseudohyphozyma bogoriensis]
MATTTTRKWSLAGEAFLSQLVMEFGDDELEWVEAQVEKQFGVPPGGGSAKWDELHQNQRPSPARTRSPSHNILRPTAPSPARALPAPASPPLTIDPSTFFPPEPPPKSSTFLPLPIPAKPRWTKFDRAILLTLSHSNPSARPDLLFTLANKVKPGWSHSRDGMQAELKRMGQTDVTGEMKASVVEILSMPRHSPDENNWTDADDTVIRSLGAKLGYDVSAWRNEIDELRLRRPWWSHHFFDCFFRWDALDSSVDELEGARMAKIKIEVPRMELLVTQALGIETPMPGKKRPRDTHDDEPSSERLHQRSSHSGDGLQLDYVPESDSENEEWLPSLRSTKPATSATRPRPSSSFYAGAPSSKPSAPLPTYLFKTKNDVRWTPAEVKKLIAAVRDYPDLNWDRRAALMKSKRSQSSLRNKAKELGLSYRSASTRKVNKMRKVDESFEEETDSSLDPSQPHSPPTASSSLRASSSSSSKPELTWSLGYTVPATSVSGGGSHSKSSRNRDVAMGEPTDAIARLLNRVDTSNEKVDFAKDDESQGLTG